LILIAAAVTLAQLSSTPDAEAEAILRMRDQQRRVQTQPQERPAPAPQGDPESLAAVIPPAIAERLTACLARANIKAEDGIADAQTWATQGGGAYAAQCRGFALGRAARWSEAASAFEDGAGTSGIDLVTQARLWSQAGNAALIGGDAARAMRDFDAALAQTLPRTLSTGEIHLDRARARVATGDNKGARADLDQAVVLAQADPLAWLLSATLARRMDDLPLARLHIEQAARRAINDAAIALEQGVIYALSGDRDPAALASFKRAQELAAPGSDIAKQAGDYLTQLNPVAEPARPARESGR
jgi:hypothetical protein